MCPRSSQTNPDPAPWGVSSAWNRKEPRLTFAFATLTTDGETCRNTSIVLRSDSSRSPGTVGGATRTGSLPARSPQPAAQSAAPSSAPARARVRRRRAEEAGGVKGGPLGEGGEGRARGARAARGGPAERGAPAGGEGRGERAGGGK